MALHFSKRELAERRRQACRRTAARGLDGLVLFRQESMYYLTGYDTSGYSMFQGMYLGADGALALCTRSADLRQAHLTSVVEDIRVWRDRAGASPAHDLRDMLESYGCRGKRLGVEYHAYGLTAQRGKWVDAALEGFCRTEDASDLVRLLRLVKSPAELGYLRRAGQLADQALAVANRLTVPGAALGAVYGEMLRGILGADGDPSASRWPMGAGQEALLVRYHTGHGLVGPRDQVTFEFAAAYRHYHAALMHVVVTGRASPRQRDMFRACREALTACQAALRPGRTVGEVFDTHARMLTRAGYRGRFLNACGYTMGATYPPTWMDEPMIYTGNPQALAPGMVFFVHMILLDSRTGLSMSLGETSVVTRGGAEPLTHAPRELVVTEAPRRGARTADR
jgi:Xaa-Pro dipeptidase